MKKLLGILVLCLLVCNTSFAVVATGYKYGKGPLKLTRGMVDILEYYFSGGKKGKWAKKQKQPWKPGFIVITSDGSGYSMYRHPLSVSNPDNRHYVGLARQKCKKKYAKECFVFANAYRIVWDNGSDKKRRILKKKEIMAGKTLQILQELGFYGDSVAQTTTQTTTPKKVEKKKKKIKKESKKKMNDDIVQQLKDLKELYDSGALTEKEYKKAKKILLD